MSMGYVRVKQALIDHRTGSMETEEVRNIIEQVVGEAAGQLGENDRRAVALFAERTIDAVGLKA